MSAVGHDSGVSRDTEAEQTNDVGQIAAAGQPQSEHDDTQQQMQSKYGTMSKTDIDSNKDRYPFCIVWTPIPLISWFFPFIGHMGIAMSSGVIRDFAGPYTVTEDNMAFGRPTKYWQLDPAKAEGGVTGWDKAVYEASEEYKHRIHNLVWDNCHSHVGMALTLMRYNQRRRWNMVLLCFMMLVRGKYVSCRAFMKTWIPFFVIVIFIVSIALIYYSQRAGFGQ